MRSKVSLRSESRRQRLLNPAVWFVLLALALPGFVSLRGACCEPQRGMASSCCATGIKMPAMETTNSAARVDSVSGLTQCERLAAIVLPDLVDRQEESSEANLLHAPGLRSGLSLALTGAFSPPLRLISASAEAGPPPLRLFDPLIVSLRI